MIGWLVGQSVGMKERATTCIKELSEDRQEAEQRNMFKLCNYTSQETGILECMNKICQDLSIRCICISHSRLCSNSKHHYYLRLM